MGQYGRLFSMFFHLLLILNSCIYFGFHTNSYISLTNEVILHVMIKQCMYSIYFDVLCLDMILKKFSVNFYTEKMSFLQMIVEELILFLLEYPDYIEGYRVKSISIVKMSCQ